MSARGVSVVVPHFGDPVHGRALVDQLLGQEGLDAIEVIVVDDASPTPFPPVDDARARVIRRPSNGGFGAAVNTGAEVATQPWLLILNSDVTLTSSDVARLLSHASPDRLVGPAVRTGGRLEAVGRKWPTPLSVGLSKIEVLQRFHFKRWYLRAIGVDIRAGGHVDSSVDWIAGVAMMLPTELFVGHGGFDQRFYMYCEETDLQRRLAELEVERVLVSEVEVGHVGGASSDPARVQSWLTTSQVTYARKWGGLWRTRACLATAAAINIVTGGARRAAGRPTRPVAEARRAWRDLRS